MAQRQSIFSVGQINTYIKNMFTQDYLLCRVAVGGEVSNLKYHPSGHIYFTLKDATGVLACVMFAGSRGGLAFAMKNGDHVVVNGSVSIYERDGRYQLYAKKITLQGAGDLYERFERLKRELEEMGMFSSEYKQPIPKYIKTLGVVTASSGAAVRDIMNIARRRNPYVQIILYPATVQGEGAAESIAKGIRMLDELGTDVIIAGRGGGSIEDLWAFNEEIVARAIFHCRTPVISAVGHETDTTIADFVADLRAPTPSAAAELAVYDYRQLALSMAECNHQLRRQLDRRLELFRQRMETYRLRLEGCSPQSQLREKQQRLAEGEERLRALLQNGIAQYRYRIALQAERLHGLSPLRKLTGGYGYVTDEAGRGVRTAEQVAPGAQIGVYLADGQLKAQVTHVERTGKARAEMEDHDVFRMEEPDE